MQDKLQMRSKLLIAALGAVLASCGKASESLGPSLVHLPASSDSQVAISQERLTFDVGISTTQGGPLREPESGSNSDPDRRPPQGGIPSGGSGGSIVPPRYLRLPRRFLLQLRLPRRFLLQLRQNPI
ncbi:hypothetical protein [Thermostichus vulcanus]|uniref:hypothetical protein n=1 Tax=Thermostichus vulcanus TaxID=32053 RepID=UPI001FCCBC76|nr:hypothetical protein [Thermostichus vulcanus]